MDVQQLMTDMGAKAREAARALSSATPADKNRALAVVAGKLRSSVDRLKEENRKDLTAGEKAGLTSAMLDRRANPGYRWYHYVSLHGVRDDTRDPYGFILHGDNHFYGIRRVPPAPGGGGVRWAILDSQHSVAAAPMDNATLDALLCRRVGRGHTSSLCIETVRCPAHPTPHPHQHTDNCMCMPGYDPHVRL